MPSLLSVAATLTTRADYAEQTMSIWDLEAGAWPRSNEYGVERGYDLSLGLAPGTTIVVRRHILVPAGGGSSTSAGPSATPPPAPTARRVVPTARRSACSETSVEWA